MEPLHQAPGLPASLATARYARHRPEATLLYELVDPHYPPFLAALERDGRTLPTFVQQEFAAYLTCGRLEHGFLRARCTQCHAERLVAFSCKRRGFCPSCGARRLVETAALLVDEILPRQPLRQWVLSVPFPLRFLFATEPASLTAVLGIVYRAINTHLIRRAGLADHRANRRRDPDPALRQCAEPEHPLPPAGGRHRPRPSWMRFSGPSPPASAGTCNGGAG